MEGGREHSAEQSREEARGPRGGKGHPSQAHRGVQRGTSENAPPELSRHRMTTAGHVSASRKPRKRTLLLRLRTHFPVE